jgi:galactonate dehydratase
VKVTDVRTTVVGSPWRDLTFLELETDDGLTGVGEVRMVNKTETLVACVNELAPRYVIGSDPFDFERLAWNIQKAEYGRPGEIAMSALAAFDLACWDVVGQALDVPLWKLLGGCFRERVPAYANGWYQADRDPDKFAELARGVVERGYRAMKVDPFGTASVELSARELRLSVGLVEAVRNAVGEDVDIFIEMHGRFSPANAIRVAKALEPLEPGWIEEPVGPENPSALRRVKEATSIPLATGERIHSLGEFRQLFEDGTVDIVQADLTHFGGFLSMKRLAGWADAYYLQMAPHNVCGPVATMANVHLAVSTPNYKVLEHFNDFSDPWVFDLVDHPPRVDPTDGCFGLPKRPGLGLKLDHDACAEHPATGGMIRLFESGWERRADSAVRRGGAP